MSDNKAQDQQAAENSRGLFSHGTDQHQTMKEHQCHHYMSTYGGYAARALVMGFAGTLGADAANALVGDVRKEWDKK